MAGHLEQIREYAALERKRTGEGVTPLEYQRWLDLRARLGDGGSRRDSESPAAAPASGSHPSPTRMVVEFKTARHFRDAWLPELTRGGVFVGTPFAAEIGTELVLCLRIADARRACELPATVVTNNVAAGFSTNSLGMGLHFGRLTPEQRLALDEVFALAAAEPA